MPRASLTAALLLLGSAAHAQTWRTLESARQLRDSSPVNVRVEYGAGRFDLRPTSNRLLYSMQVRYDEERARPVHRYDAGERSLRLGIDEASSIKWNAMSGDDQGEMRLELPLGVPMDLHLALGATKARIDLGGLSLRNLRLQSGATSAEVEFSEPNAEPMERLEVDVGAAGIVLNNLANSRAKSLRVNGGVGGIELDFGGRWTQDMSVEAEVTMGKVTLHVPQDVGVRMEVGRVVAGFQHQGLVKRGDAWFSENWDKATHRLRVRARATFGGIEVDRTR